MPGFRIANSSLIGINPATTAQNIRGIPFQTNLSVKKMESKALGELVDFAYTAQLVYPDDSPRILEKTAILVATDNLQEFSWAKEALAETVEELLENNWGKLLQIVDHTADERTWSLAQLWGLHAPWKETVLPYAERNLFRQLAPPPPRVVPQKESDDWRRLETPDPHFVQIRVHKEGWSFEATIYDDVERTATIRFGRRQAGLLNRLILNIGLLEPPFSLATAYNDAKLDPELTGRPRLIVRSARLLADGSLDNETYWVASYITPERGAAPALYVKVKKDEFGFEEDGLIPYRDFVRAYVLFMYAQGLNGTYGFTPYDLYKFLEDANIHFFSEGQEPEPKR